MIEHSLITWVSIFGATGSVGQSALDVIAEQQQFAVYAVTGCTNVERMKVICLQCQPKIAVMANEEAGKRLKAELGIHCVTEIRWGSESLNELAEDLASPIVIAAIVGAAGLAPTLAAARAGKRIILANKETIVMAGELFRQTIENSGAVLLPIDSEHNALFQCLPPPTSVSALHTDINSFGVRRMVLTASGGPFRQFDRKQLEHVTPAQACAHPNWTMGPKISVDSATLMNKGLEWIEACWLFSLHYSQLEVVVHPQSVIHSMVEFTDGTTLAHLSAPTMNVPLAHALGWPNRLTTSVSSIDLIKVGQLTFEALDEDLFPALGLARWAQNQGGTACVTLNAANEEAVAAFLAGKLNFLQIYSVIEDALVHVPVIQDQSMDNILGTDGLARRRARTHIQLLNTTVCV